MKPQKTFKEGLFASLLAAHVIIILHVVLLASIGMIIILFGGVYHYLPWILGGVAVFILLTALILYRQVKNRSSQLQTILNMPQFQERNVELKLMGGLVSLNLNTPESETIGVSHQLTDGQTPALIDVTTNSVSEQHSDQMDTLTALYEKDLISEEDDSKAKETLTRE